MEVMPISCYQQGTRRQDFGPLFIFTLYLITILVANASAHMDHEALNSNLHLILIG